MFDFNEKKRKTLIISTIVYAVLILLFILVVNFDKFSAFFTIVGNKLSVFASIFIGAILAYLCCPLIRWYQDRIFVKIPSNRFRRFLSILSTYITLLFAVVLFVALVVPRLLASIEELIIKMSDGTYLTAAIDWANDILNSLLDFQDNYAGEPLIFIDANKVTRWLQDFFNDSTGYIQILTNSLLSYISKFFVSIKNLFLGLLLSIYFVISKERIQAMFKKICMAFISKKNYDRLCNWSTYTDKTFGGFVIGKLIDAVFMMVICSIAFSIAEVPYAILIATVVGIANIIPFFGPFIGAIPSGLIVLIADPSKFLLFCILLLVIQQFDANVIEPKIVGDKIGLSSLGVISAVIIMGGYFGIFGAFFGVPIFAVICTLTNAWIDSRLQKKDYSVALADYYSEKSLVDPNEEKRVGLRQRMLTWLNDKVIQKVKTKWKNRKNKSDSGTEETTAEKPQNNNSDEQ